MAKGETRPEERPLERLPTGIARLDFILKGGLLQGATYVVLGTPGTGKTVMANQICFNHARRGQRALFFTLLTESHARMLTNLRSMAFFESEFLPERLQYLSGYDVLEKSGLEGLLKFIQKAVRAFKPTFVVIDGLDAAAEFSPSALSFKKYLHEQQAFLSLYGCTTLYLAPSDFAAARPITTAVDGVIQLTLRNVGPRAVRELNVLKFRGSDYLLGLHEVEISSAGMVIHPRTEVQFATPGESGREDRIRMPFGIPKLDAALHGGLLSGSTTTLLGGPGTGKTLLGLKFLAEGADHDQPGVYFGFYETPPRLVEKAEAIGIPLEKHLRSGLIEIQWQPPLEANLDALAERLLERIKERDVRHKRLRLFVDSLAGFRAASVYPDRMGRFLSAISHQLRILDVTVLYAEETSLFPAQIEMPVQELGAAVENVIFLRNVELRSQLYRLISILKMRESPYDSAIREFRITGKGIDVAGSFESAEAILSGQARQVGGGALVGGGPEGTPARKRKRRLTRRRS